MPDDTAYTIADLARLTGLNVRTIRYYIAQGLIPASGESGPGAHYGQGHLDRLRLTKRLQQQHLPLAEIRQRLAALSDDEVAGLLETTPEPGAPETSALDYVRTVLASAARTPVASIPPAPSIPPMPSALTGQTPALAQAASVPPLAALSAMPAPPGEAMIPGQQPAGGRIGRMFLREAPPPLSRVVSPPDVLPSDGRGMPRMKDVEPITESQPLERSQWERLSLGPNIELHVRRPLGRLEQRRVERLITIARQVLKEDGV